MSYCTELNCSAFHLGLDNKNKEDLLQKILKRNDHVKNIQKYRVLIVDEISMVNGRMLDRIDYVCRYVRRASGRPFGGIKV